jgi:hypothetical protein
LPTKLDINRISIGVALIALLGVALRIAAAITFYP